MASKKIDRISRYAQFHALSRLAVLRVMNATEKARVAQNLHPSRQAAHLEEASEELRLAVSMLLEASVELVPMKKFQAYEKRNRKKKSSRVEERPAQTYEHKPTEEERVTVGTVP